MPTVAEDFDSWDDDDDDDDDDNDDELSATLFEQKQMAQWLWITD